jgi:hypothetical protein
LGVTNPAEMRDAIRRDTVMRDAMRRDAIRRSQPSLAATGKRVLTPFLVCETHEAVNCCKDLLQTFSHSALGNWRLRSGG